MSLIVVVRLQSDELLFVADRCVASADATDEVLNHSANTLKLRELNGGIVGMVGDSGIALSFAEKIGPSPNAANVVAHTQQRLSTLYDELLRPLESVGPSQEAEAGKLRDQLRNACSYLLGTYDSVRQRSELIDFSPENFFVARAEVGSVTTRGMVGHAERLLHFFQRDSYTLEQGQRLATLLALATHRVCPNSVSHDVDMWMLGGDGITKYSVEEIRRLQEFSGRFLDRLKSDLYQERKPSMSPASPDCSSSSSENTEISRSADEEP